MYENVWSKSVWIPFWTLQLVSSAIFLALAAAALIVWKDHSDDYVYRYGSSYSVDSDELDRTVNVVYGVFIGISALTCVINVLEIVLFARKRLSPVAAVIFDSITTAIWLGVFVLITLATVGGTTSVFSWILIIAACAASIGKLAYGSVILHRNRKRFAHRKGAYTSASTTAEPALESSPNGLYTAHNAGEAATMPMRNMAPAAHQHSGSTVGEFYDPENIRSTRYA